MSNNLTGSNLDSEFKIFKEKVRRAEKLVRKAGITPDLNNCFKMLH